MLHRPFTSRDCIRPLRVFALLLASGLLIAEPGFAQSAPSDPIAQTLKASGDRAMVEARFDDALDAYTKALAVQPSAALHYNRGRALQGLGRNAEALGELELFERQATPDLLTAVPGLSDLLSTVRAHVAELSIKVVPPGATLRIDGTTVPLPLEAPLRFDPRDVSVVIEADGYVPLRVTLALAGGERRELRPRLQRRDTTAVLRVRSTIVGADVVLDGKQLGTAPLEVRLRPGTHRLDLRHPDYRVSNTQVVLRSNERRDIELSAQRLPRFYEKWWFWSTVGVVSAGAVVAVVAATTEKSPSSGDIPPGRLSIGLGSR